MITLNKEMFLIGLKQYIDMYQNKNIIDFAKHLNANKIIEENNEKYIEIVNKESK